jgi:hypothetical protein
VRLTGSAFLKSSRCQKRLFLIETLTIEPTTGTKNDSLELRWEQPAERYLDQKSRRNTRLTDRAESKPMTGKVFRGPYNRNRIAGFKATPIGEECRVLDNFYASHSALDGRIGHEFRSRRDASVTGFGNDFGSHKLSVPTYVVKLTKTTGPNLEKLSINSRA